MTAKMSRASILFMLILGCGYAAAQIEAGTEWVNQSGSVFTIREIDDDGKITGTYINGNANFNCVGTPYPLTGWVIENAITFTVLWKNAHESCDSLTSWTGFYALGTITAHWQLIRAGAASADKIFKGESVFTLKSPDETEEPQKE